MDSSTRGDATGDSDRLASNASEDESGRFDSMSALKSAIFCSAVAMASAPARNRRGGGCWAAIMSSACASFAGSPACLPCVDFQAASSAARQRA
jgi:hypothetical protein